MNPDELSNDNKLSNADELSFDNELSFDDAFQALDAPVMTIIADIELPEPTVQEPTMILADEFDADANVLVGEIRETFKREIVFDRDDLFTNPVPTTLTMDGFLTNVRIHEQELIKILEPTPMIVALDCNFGTKIHPSYVPTVKTKNTNRGRKKMPRKESNRVMQGTGKCFGSQLTFEILRAVPAKTGARVYKFKLFRNGRLQLPGAQPDVIEDIVEKVFMIVDTLNATLHPDELDISKRTQAVNINTVMKNYKFYLKLNENQLINLSMLKQILLDHKKCEHDDAPACRPIVDIKHTREETNVSILFSTPTPKKSTKCLRVNIYMLGKVNILGSYYDAYTKQVCEYLYYIFTKHPNVVVTKRAPTRLGGPQLMSGNICDYMPAPIYTEFSEAQAMGIVAYVNGLVTPMQ